MRALQAVLALSAMLVVLVVAVALAPAVGARDPCPPCGGPQNKGIACTAEDPKGSLIEATIGPVSATFRWQVTWPCSGWPPDQNLCRICYYVEVEYWDGRRWEQAGSEALDQESGISCGSNNTLPISTTVSYAAGTYPPGTPMLFVVRALPWDPATGANCDANLFYPAIIKKPWKFP